MKTKNNIKNNTKNDFDFQGVDVNSAFRVPHSAFNFLTPQESDHPYTVSEINGGIARILEGCNTLVWVEGEISGWKHYPSGHCYFKLKDESSQIPAVMWKSSAVKLDFTPKDGESVFAIASIRVYEKGGYYQLDVHKLMPAGAGALSLAFEKLKEKLLAEGLFDEEHKRPLPRSVTTLGVITSKQGAALWDIVRVVATRAPQTNIVFIDTPVQGDHAAAKIAANIRAMNEYNAGLTKGNDCLTGENSDALQQCLLFDDMFCDTQANGHTPIDVMIVGRGGGSIEDLWAFNEEAVARAIYESQIPVVSAVGHEIDFTIADFVADVRAPTPSAAAEMTVADTKDNARYYDKCAARFASAIGGYIADINRRVKRIKSSRGLTLPRRLLQDAEQSLDDTRHRFGKNVRSFLDLRNRQLQTVAGRINALSPLATLSRGYSVVTNASGAMIKSVKSVNAGEHVDIRFSDGIANAKIV